MAQLDVQPKKSNPWWIWLLLAIVLLALIFYFLRDRPDASEAGNMNDTTVTDNTAIAAEGDWNSIDRNAPEASYDEITSTDVSVRGNEEYAIYSVDETILFETEQGNIRPQAAETLKQITSSVEKRFSGGQIRIFGYTDARGSTSYNKELAEQRAESVKNWLVENGSINADRITVNAVGEAQPVATNETAAGRQKNRRVEIIVRRQ